MKKILLLLTLLPTLGAAQVICDFGIGFGGGVFRLSEAKDAYEHNSIQNPHTDFDSSQYFFVKPGDGVTFGLSAMMACTLTTPDSRIFYTATARPSFGLAQFQMYTPRFSLSTLTPEELWLRDSLRPVRAGAWCVPLLAHVNYNISPEHVAVYFGLGASINGMKLDQRKEFNRVETIVVAEDDNTPSWLDRYHAYYLLKPFVKVETQIGIIWTGRRERQHEAFISASMGKGKQGSVMFGYFWRFNFFNE